MNYKFTSIIVLVVLLFVSGNVEATAVKPINDIYSDLKSQDPEVRRTAMRSFAGNQPTQYGEKALQLIVNTLGDHDERIRIYALSALSQLGGKHNPQVVKNMATLKPLLYQGLNDLNVKVSRLAAESLSRIFGSATTLENRLFQLIKSTNDDKYRNDLIRAIAFDGIESKEVQTGLLQLLKTANIGVKEMIVIALMAAESPPKSLLPELINIAELAKHYGSSIIVQYIAKYGQEAKPYLPRLRQIRNKILAEQKLMRKDRTVKVYQQHMGQKYQDTYTFKTLEKTISELEMIK